MNFQQYLISQGWSPFNLKFHKVAGNLVMDEIPCKNIDFFSTIPGPDGQSYIDIRFKKNGKTIYFGLHEAGLPPTLIWPLPPGVKSDNDMNKLLMDSTPEDILTSLKWPEN